MVSKPQLSKKQIFLSRIVLGGAFGICGLFLLLCGLDAINLPILKVLLPAALLSLSLVCFFWAFIQDNTLMLWLGLPFALAGCVSILAEFTTRGYGFYYPIYLIAPAAASLVTAIYSGRWEDHLKIIAFFGGLSVLFALNSMAGVSLKIILPIVVLFFGTSIIVWALNCKKEQE